MPATRVLLVDDSPEFLQFTRRLLEETTDLEVVGSATSAEQALPEVERLAPDLVLMDWAMSGMTGLQATRRLKALPAPPRVVLVTGSDTAEHREAARAAGADAFLAKPELLHGLGPLLASLFPP
jgi:CheY-like chemotaxis protein